MYIPQWMMCSRYRIYMYFFHYIRSYGERDKNETKTVNSAGMNFEL